MVISSPLQLWKKKPRQHKMLRTAATCQKPAFPSLVGVGRLVSRVTRVTLARVSFRCLFSRKKNTNEKKKKKKKKQEKMKKKNSKKGKKAIQLVCSPRRLKKNCEAIEAERKIRC